MNWKFHNPVAVHFGAGALRCLPELLPPGPVALILYPQASAELRAELGKLLGERGVHLIDDVPSNPTMVWCKSHYAALHTAGSDLAAVVAVGGGSVIDAGKTLAVLTDSGSFDEVEHHLKHGRHDGIRGSLPLFSVPTTAGTGSEVTPWATVWNFQEQGGPGAKYSLHLPSSWSQAAIVDPVLTLALPVEVMRNSALDALSHSLEAIWNVNANPISDQFALDAASGVLQHLEAAMSDPSDLQARVGLSRSALLGGLAFSNTKTALAHSLSYPMTLERGLAHGLACSFTLPTVWRMALGHDSKRDALLGAVFGTSPAEGADLLEALLHRVGVATEFSDYGVSKDEAAALLHGALDGVRGKNFIGREMRKTVAEPG